MALDIKTIRDGLKTRLETIDGLRCHDTIPGDVVAPAAVVVPDDPFITYHEAMSGGLCFANFKITLLCSDGSKRTGQDLLDEYLSAGTGMSKSVHGAINGDTTLDGAINANNLIVSEARDYGVTEISGKQFWKADLLVRIQHPRL